MKTNRLHQIPERILIFFVDGVGLGSNREENPLVSAPMPILRNLLGNAPLTQERVGYFDGRTSLGSLDARLGIPGLPQSATGQATLLTGQNIAKQLGRHWPGLPTKSIQEKILRYSIFRTLKSQEKNGIFANYFDSNYFENALKRRFPHSATTWSALAADYSLHSGFEALKYGQAVYHDLTGRSLVERGRAVIPISPYEAGRRLGNIAHLHDVTLYEYFLTDQAGHRRDLAEAQRVLRQIDEALAGILETLDTERSLLILVSDHGNIEDLSTKTHTLHPVPLLAVGPGSYSLTSRARSLTDLAPYLRWWGQNHPLF